MTTSGLLKKVATFGVATLVGGLALGLSQEAKAATATAQSDLLFSDLEFTTNFGIDISDFFYSTSCQATVNGVTDQDTQGPTAFPGPVAPSTCEVIDGLSTANATAFTGAGIGVGFNQGTSSFANAEGNMETASGTSEFLSLTGIFDAPDDGTFSFQALLEAFISAEVVGFDDGESKLASTGYLASFTLVELDANGNPIRDVIAPIIRGNTGGVINQDGTFQNGAVPDGVFTPGTLDEMFAGTDIPFGGAGRYQAQFTASTDVNALTDQIAVPEPGTVLGLLAIGGLGLGLKRKQQS